VDPQKRFRLAYLFISHDLTAVCRVCSLAAIMCLGEIIGTGATEAMFERPLHPCSRALLSFVLYPDPRQKPSRFVLRGEIPSPLDLPSGGHLHQRCPSALVACQHACPPLAAVSRGRFNAGFRISEMA
jgi:oligopeptide transport system ATP-binding protein